MSYILEALRKAEQERNLGRVPDLQTASMPTPQKKRRLWPLWLGLVLVINGVALAVLLWPDYWNRLVSPVKQSAVSTAEPAFPSSGDTTAYDPAQQISNPQTESTPPTPVPAQVVQSANPEPISTLEPIAIPVTSPPPLPSLEDSPTDQASSSVLALQVLPMEFRRAVPKLNLDVHVYSASIRKRFVLINSKRYQEGDRLNEGPLLESITADGAVLSYQGQRFLLPVYQ